MKYRIVCTISLPSLLWTGLLFTPPTSDSEAEAESKGRKGRLLEGKSPKEDYDSLFSSHPILPATFTPRARLGSDSDLVITGTDFALKEQMCFEALQLITKYEEEILDDGTVDYVPAGIKEDISEEDYEMAAQGIVPYYQDLLGLEGYELSPQEIMEAVTSAPCR